MMALPKGCISWDKTSPPIFIFFSTFDEFGIGRARSDFYFHRGATSRPLQQADAWSCELQKEWNESGICGLKTCHQANYVFMKKVEQISG